MRCVIMSKDNEIITDVHDVQVEIILDDFHQLDQFIQYRIINARLGIPSLEEAENWIVQPKPPLGKLIQL